MFHGSSFLYGGIPSEVYGLRISDIDSQAINESMGSSSMDILNQRIIRRPIPYFFSASPSPVLSFEMTAFSEEEISADFFALLQKVFFSSRIYNKLQIDQYDMQNVYFNCILNNPKIVRVGNLLRGIKFSVDCNAPFAFNFPKTVTYNYTVPIVNSPVVYNNTSDDTGNYLYPTTVITINLFGGNFSIINVSDSNRVSSFTGLSAGEQVTVNSSSETIVSSIGLKRLSNFNKKFLRLIWINNLLISGAVSQFSMTTQTIAKKISG